MTVVLPNPGRRPRGGPSRRAGSGEATAIHRRLPGYAPTPLVAAPTLAAAIGVGELWVKDESSRLGLPAFKILGASWAAFRSLCALVALDPGRTTVDALGAALAVDGGWQLVTATDGNHGRAVAHMAALLGIGARILVPRGTAAARIESIAGEGATVEVVDGSYDDAVEAAAALASDRAVVISDTSWPGYREVPAWVVDGYRTIFAEADEQLAAQGAVAPDVVVVQMGVGSLAVAAVRYRWSGEPSDPTIVVVEPTSAACGLRSAEAGHPVVVPGPHRSIMAGLNCGSVSEQAWPELSAGVDVFVGIEDADAEQAMRDLDGLGIVAGETGGSGLAGLRALVAEGSYPLPADASVLVINTEGATDPANHARICCSS